jgi:adenosylhomocysteine nucleosidase
MTATTTAPAFRLGIVTGLRFEAAIARRAIEAAPFAGTDSATVACHGPGQVRGSSAAAELLAAGATALLAFGVAGGCDPALPPGAVVLSTGVRDLSAGGKGEVLYTNRDWHRRLKFRLLGSMLVKEALIASAADPVTGAAAKRGLFDELNAAAVDMESAAVARAAIEASVPFMALRAIVDGAGIGLPESALAGLGLDGGAQAAAVARTALRRPQDIPALIRLAFANNTAKKSLGRIAAATTPLFGAV